MWQRIEFVRIGDLIINVQKISYIKVLVDATGDVYEIFLENDYKPITLTSVAYAELMSRIERLNREYGTL